MPNGPITDPYASHLPVLRGLCQMLKPKRVLEFGQGKYSTGYFLGSAYGEDPQVDQLVSVETDPKWAWRRDDRHYVRTIRLSPEGFDLVFIDDGEDGDLSRRVETIKWVLARQNGAVVVVHDVDREEYADAIRRLPGVDARMTWVNVWDPATAVVWPGKNRTEELAGACL